MFALDSSLKTPAPAAKSSFRRQVSMALLLGLGPLLGPAPLLAQDLARPAGDQDPRRAREKVLIYKIEGLVQPSDADRLEKRLEYWLKQEPAIKTLILRIDSRGSNPGQLEAVKKCADLIFKLNEKGIKTFAHIDNGKEASNGAALIAMACSTIYMGKGARLGHVKDPGTELPDAKEKDALEARRLINFYAGARRRNYPPSFAAALVSQHHSEYFEVTFDRQVGGNKIEEREILSREDLNGLDPARKTIMRQEKKSITAPGDRLSLSADEAYRYGVAEKQTENPFEGGGIEELLNKARILVGKEDIIDDQRGFLKPTSPAGQWLVDLLNHNLVRFFLLLGGFMGLLLELKMPGTFAPIATGCLCFALLFIGGFFPVTNAVYPTTSPYEVLVAIIGLGCIVLEFFLFPGAMVFGLSGFAMLVIGVVLAMVPPSGGASADTMDFKSALLLFSMALGLGLGIFFMLVKFLPQTSILGRRGLVTHAALHGIPTADSAIEAQQRNAALLGQTGTAVSPLRPAGRADVNGQILDVVADEGFIENGEKVKIIEASDFRILVQRSQ
ncbi:MAG: hypothetical protein HY717_17285 [Planctomycetes bacterium]|nr:hypothetical protein [Planctomycetota bacterium]